MENQKSFNKWRRSIALWMFFSQGHCFVPFICDIWNFSEGYENSKVSDNFVILSLAGWNGFGKKIEKLQQFESLWASIVSHRFQFFRMRRILTFQRSSNRSGIFRTVNCETRWIKLTQTIIWKTIWISKFSTQCTLHSV